MEIIGVQCSDMRSERNAVLRLRSQGKTYSEIQNILRVHIPKSTLSQWCKEVKMSATHKLRIEMLSSNNLERGRKKSLIINSRKRIERVRLFQTSNTELWDRYTKDDATRKIVLAILYIAEGHKNRDSVVFGNSDPGIIRMFMRLMRSTYKIDESKFRITVQCRADQNPEILKIFWSKVTKVSYEQFYKPQIDKRTVGKPTKKRDYKGVCRIDYFSTVIDQELKYIARNLEKR